MTEQGSHGHESHADGANSGLASHGGHDHGGHAHGVSAHGVSVDANARYLSIALGLIVGFMVAEAIVAVLSGSLALLADSGHMLTDAGALGASLWAARLATRPAAGAWTFGFKRAEILSAAGNGITLLLVSALVTFESIRRLIHPSVVGGLTVVIVALVGVAVNLVAAWTLAKANRSSLNVEGSFQHIVTDLYGASPRSSPGSSWWSPGSNGPTPSPRSSSWPSWSKHPGVCSRHRGGCYSRPPPTTSTSPTSAPICWAPITFQMSMISTPGRSPPICRSCPPTSWSTIHASPKDTPLGCSTTSRHA